MNIFITRLNGWGYDDTAQYAQVMSANIAHQMGFKEMAIYGFREFGESDELLSARLDGVIAGVQRGDIVYFQYPTWNGLRYDEALLKKLKNYGCKVIFFVHDVGAFMEEGRKGELEKTVEILNGGDALIVASKQLKELLINKGVNGNIPFIIQEIWDYATEMNFVKRPEYKKEIKFAGNPSKFTFANEWNYRVPLSIYTGEECKGGNAIKKGWKEQHVLLMDLAEGGFGLVWHAHEMWKEYMKYNNTMKLSAYLAAGIPVIISRGLSNQKLLEENHLAIVVDSLDEAVEIVDNMTPEAYGEYVDACGRFAVLMRQGFFTRKVLVDAMHAVCRVIRNECFASSYGEESRVMDMFETLKYVEENKVSIARFGDGEIDLINGEGIAYQNYDTKLSKQLIDIIKSNDTDRLLVCLPDVFEKTFRYNDFCLSFWKNHISKYQEFYENLFTKKRVYGSTFFSRPYIDLRDKSLSGVYFNKLKRFFSEKDILIVEGENSKSGVGNDLFDGVNSIERIICPSKDAYNVYYNILNVIINHGKGKLILLMLGPTAKLLANDLSKKGFWAIDMGHIDTEYEWFKMGATTKVQLHNKHTAEFNYDLEIEDIHDEKYESQIIARI